MDERLNIFRAPASGEYFHEWESNIFEVQCRCREIFSIVTSTYMSHWTWHPWTRGQQEWLGSMSDKRRHWWGETGQRGHRDKTRCSHSITWKKSNMDYRGQASQGDKLFKLSYAFWLWNHGGENRRHNFLIWYEMITIS